MRFRAFKQCSECGQLHEAPLVSLGNGAFKIEGIKSLHDLFVGGPQVEAPSVVIEGDKDRYRIIHLPTSKVWSHADQRWWAPPHDGGFWYIGRKASRDAWESMIASGKDPAASEAAASGDAPAASTSTDARRQDAAESRADQIIKDKFARAWATLERARAELEDLRRHFA